MGNIKNTHKCYLCADTISGQRTALVPMTYEKYGPAIINREICMDCYHERYVYRGNNDWIPWFYKEIMAWKRK